MMIEIGDALVLFGILGTISTAVIKFVPRRNGNGNVSEKTCMERREHTHELMKVRFDNLEAKMDELITHVKK